MKSSFLRSAAVLALALGLASCGGKASFVVNVTVTGLKYNGLVLTNGGDTLTPTVATPPLASISLAFPTQISYGSSFNVVATTQPPHQSCTPYTSTTTGSAGHTATINATFSCTDVLHTFGGTVKGLTGTGLVLNYGSEITTSGTPATVAVTAPAAGAADPTYVLPVSIAFGTVYTVTVLTQPSSPSQVCTVVNGTGVMGDTDIIATKDASGNVTSDGIVVNCQ